MNIWSKLGISVALIAVFCIAVAELLQPSVFYQHYKWSVCVALVISGGALFATGRLLNRRNHSRYLQAQAELPEQDRDSDATQWQPFLLFNLAYWGVIIVIFGCIIVFLVPTHKKREKAKVAARVPPPAPRKPQPPVPAPKIPNTIVTNTPVQMPRFHLQGITLRQPHPSALINGRTYFEGDLVHDAVVMLIDSNVVVLDWRGIKVTLQPPN